MAKEDYLLVTEIAEDIGLSPANIRQQAYTDPSKLGFPVCVCGSSIRVPKSAYLKWKNGD